jgi:hypothetical protein
MDHTRGDQTGDDRFIENDHRETKLGYGDGGVPFYVAVAWVLFIIAYVVVMASLALPDLRAWAGR